MKEANFSLQDVHQTLDAVMKRILDLGQSSLSEAQFQAFRKMTMDFFADGKRSLRKGESPKGQYDQGRYGISKSMAKGAVL